MINHISYTKIESTLCVRSIVLTVNMKKSFLFYMDSNHVLMNMEKICGIRPLNFHDHVEEYFDNLISKF